MRTEPPRPPDGHEGVATEVSRHEWAEGEETAEGLVLLCECGWRTSPAGDGVEAGRAWDAHLRAVRSAGHR